MALQFRAIFELGLRLVLILMSKYDMPKTITIPVCIYFIYLQSSKEEGTLYRVVG